MHRWQLSPSNTDPWVTVSHPKSYNFCNSFDTDMLQANGIAPVIGTKKRSAVSQVADEDEEIRALEVSRRNPFGIFTYLCVAQNRLNDLKSQRSKSNGNSSKRVKLEPRNPSSLGEVIDLT
jgi:hypothetical protein